MQYQYIAHAQSGSVAHRRCHNRSGKSSSQNLSLFKKL